MRTPNHVTTTASVPHALLSECALHFNPVMHLLMSYNIGLWHMLKLYHPKYRIFSNLIRTLFYSLRGLKKSDADYNRVRIRFAVERWILEK